MVIYRFIPVYREGCKVEHIMMHSSITVNGYAVIVHMG